MNTPISPVDGIVFDLVNETKQGRRITDQERINAFRKLIEVGNVTNLAFMLPMLLNLDGQPYTLDNHFPFEPLFNVYIPRRTILKTGRQVAKSTSLASRSLIMANAIEHFHILFCTPLYEQIRRFSTNYMRKFIEQSPLKELWIGTGTENSVLQRSFRNYSQMFFSFALTDADRIRGLSCHSVNLDEIQDMDKDLIPIIEEVQAAKRIRTSLYAGTPKTLDNTLENKWLASSMAEWAIPCRNCKKLNIPRMGYDLEKIIGPWHADISENHPATICAADSCRKPIFPRDGFWLHQKPERMSKFPGYHVPQCIMPMHYADKDRWSELLAKQQGFGNCTVPQFYNEVLGESYDLGAKLLTKTDLMEASVLPWENKPVPAKECMNRLKDYTMRVMGVDWGGGGEDEVSFTVMAVLGVRGDGKLDVLYGRKLLTPHDHMAEAVECIRVFNTFQCHLFAHDYNGAGSLRETIAIQSGLPYHKVVPIVYRPAATKNIVTFHKSESEHSRNFWLVDKPRSLQTVCQGIKQKWVRLFKYDHKSEEDPGLMHDFLALMENKIEMPRGGDIYTIQRNPNYADDFAHAVNFAACAIWHSTRTWPNFAKLAGLQATAEQMKKIAPKNAWNEQGGFFGQP